MKPIQRSPDWRISFPDSYLEIPHPILSYTKALFGHSANMKGISGGRNGCLRNHPALDASPVGGNTYGEGSTLNSGL